MSIENTDTSRDGGNPGLWAATDRGEESEWLNATNPAYLRASQQAWRRAIEADFPFDGDIQCDPRTFMPLANVQLTTLGAIGGAPELRVRALAAAGRRMGLVGADGREAKSAQDRHRSLAAWHLGRTRFRSHESPNAELAEGVEAPAIGVASGGDPATVVPRVECLAPRGAHCRKPYPARHEDRA